MSQVTLLTGLITDAGYGRLDTAIITACEEGLLRVISANPEKRASKFEEDLISNLTLVINEHDRQLREIRLQILVEASEQLERRLEMATSPSDLINSRRKKT